MTNGKTATSSVVNRESEMALARIAAGINLPAPRKYMAPFDDEALDADLRAYEAAGRGDDFSLLNWVYLPNGKKLGDCTGDEVASYVPLERLVTAQRALTKLIGAELARLATQAGA